MPPLDGYTPKPCPSCGSHDSFHMLSGRHKPVSSTVVFDTPAEAKDIPSGDIDLACCRNCGLIFNRIFDNALARVSASYESSQAGSAHFNAFARNLVNDWVTRYDLKGKTVLEVGSGQSEFLVEMIKGGIGHGIALDPLAVENDVPEAFRDRITVVAADYGPEHADIEADALVTRHTLEHVGDVSGFLKTAAAWSRKHAGKPILLEVPGADRILAEGAFWDIWFEHCNYFTVGSITRAFRLAGMDVTRAELVYDGQYILVEAHASTSDAPVVLDDAGAEVAQCEAFEKTFAAAIDTCHAKLRGMVADGGPVVIWQAAAKTVGLSSWLGPDAPFACAVDLNARRHGFFLPPFGIAIRAPADLTQIQPRHVVLMNPVYEKEVGAELVRLGVTGAHLQTIDRLCAPN